MKKLSSKPFDLNEMQNIEGGSCNTTLAAAAAIFAVASLAVPVAGEMAGGAILLWAEKCL